MSCVWTTTILIRFAPLLRRIFILVAVITAVPVMLWTITAFMRTYVGAAGDRDGPAVGVNHAGLRHGKRPCRRASGG